MNICIVDTCNKQVYAHSLCSSHNRRKRLYGDPEGKPTKQTKLCDIESCNKKHYCLGFCRVHYRRLKDKGNPYWEPTKYDLICTVEDCNEERFVREFCRLHYSRHKSGKELVGPRKKSIGVFETEFVTTDGYVRVCMPGKVVKLKHRMVMEEYLGRPLSNGENVHHINGNRADNRLENLELWSTAQPSGQRVSDKIRWANNIIAQYGSDPNEF